MIEKAELLRVPVLEGLPDGQVDWFIHHSRELSLKAGEVCWCDGDPADAMFIILEGEVQARGEVNGEMFIVTTPPGHVTGLLPFSRMKKYTFTGRAVSDSRILHFPASLFPELVQKMPELATRLVALMSDRVREITRMEQQRDRLVALGKLAAGLAHEINNPASAAKRASSQLRDMLKQIRDASHELETFELTSAQRQEIDKIETFLMQQHESPLDTLAVGNLEEQIDSFLSSHGINGGGVAASLARKGATPDMLGSRFATLDDKTTRAVVLRISAAIEVVSLLGEIESSTSRISDLVRAVKEYTYMDQAPVQNVDVVRSLETTLTILSGKLKRGISVKREYQRVPFLVDSFGSELNQVWTNLIDNAVDAMSGKGELRLCIYREDKSVVVEVGDNGPGIPAEIRPHIFEPFFTTKGVGQGTGLGLDIVQRIVKKHQGNIQVCSNPGDTRFQVRLPLAETSP